MAALKLMDGRGRAVDVEQGVVPLALLVDRIGEVAQTPILGLADLGALLFQKSGKLLDEGIDLRRGDVGSCNDHVFVECQFWLPCLDRGAGAAGDCTDDGPRQPGSFQASETAIRSANRA